MSYDEHLISMAGGDGDNATDQLAAIEARADKVVEWRKHFVSPQSNIDYSQRDVPALIALVREQQDKLDRVEALINKAFTDSTYILPGGYPSRPVEASDLRAAITATEEGK